MLGWLLVRRFKPLVGKAELFHRVGVLGALRKKDYAFPDLLDSDIQETMAHGDGPGGQKVNTSMNAVRLVHVPTGLTIKCHETRSTAQNRKIARERLLTKLDNHLNGENSFEALKRKDSKTKQAKDSVAKAKKRELKQQAKLKFGKPET